MSFLSSVTLIELFLVSQVFLVVYCHRHQVCPSGTSIEINYELFCDQSSISRHNNNEDTKNFEPRLLLPSIPESHRSPQSRCKIKPTQSCISTHKISEQGHMTGAIARSNNNSPKIISMEEKQVNKTSSFENPPPPHHNCNFYYKMNCEENRDPKCRVEPVSECASSLNANSAGVISKESDSGSLNNNHVDDFLHHGETTTNVESINRIVDVITQKCNSKTINVKHCDDLGICVFQQTCQKNSNEKMLFDDQIHQRKTLEPFKVQEHSIQDHQLNEDEYRLEHSPYTSDHYFQEEFTEIQSPWLDSDDPPVVTKSLDNFYDDHYESSDGSSDGSSDESSMSRGLMEGLYEGSKSLLSGIFGGGGSSKICIDNLDEEICDIDCIPDCYKREAENCKLTTQGVNYEICHNVVNLVCKPKYELDTLEEDKLPANCINRKIQICDVFHRLKKVPRRNVPQCATVSKISCDTLKPQGFKNLVKNCSSKMTEVCQNLDVLVIEVEELKDCRERTVISCFEESDKELLECVETTDILCGNQESLELVPSECIEESINFCINEPNKDCKKTNCKKMC